MKTQWVRTGSSPHGFTWKGSASLTPYVVIGEPNFKQIWWMEKALNAARHVARIRCPAGTATGFLVRKDLLLTNHHVLENKQDCAGARIQFNYRSCADGSMAPIDEYACDADGFFNTDAELDYTIVKLKPKNSQHAGAIWGTFTLNPAQPLVGQRINIIQHPRGRSMEIAFRDNQIKAVSDHFIQYITDTDYGSSGSPVLDDWFDLIALHSQRVKDPKRAGQWTCNQGTRMSAIIRHAGSDLFSR